jgi:CDP-4-dehydro-6-deoxyglucose reductase, E1
VVRFLEDHKVGTRLVFAGNLTKQPAYAGRGFRVHGSLKNTDEIMCNAFWIGVHPRLTDAHIAYVLEQLEAAVKASR